MQKAIVNKVKIKQTTTTIKRVFTTRRVLKILFSIFLFLLAHPRLIQTMPSFVLKIPMLFSLHAVFMCLQKILWNSGGIVATHSKKREIANFVPTHLFFTTFRPNFAIHTFPHSFSNILHF